MVFPKGSEAGTHQIFFSSVDVIFNEKNKVLAKNFVSGVLNNDKVIILLSIVSRSLSLSPVPNDSELLGPTIFFSTPMLSDILIQCIFFYIIVVNVLGIFASLLLARAILHGWESSALNQSS